MSIASKPIVLLDETIREGDARGYHPKSPEERLALVREIHRVTAVRDFCLGWCVFADNDRRTLAAFLSAQRERTLSEELVAHIFELFQSEPQADELIASLAPTDRARVVIDFAVVANDILVKTMDAPWLSARSGVDTSTLSAEEIHARLYPEVTARIRKRVTMGLHHVGLIIQDVFRAAPETVRGYIRAAREGGATVVRLHDTVGIATPLSTSKTIASLVADFPDVTFFAHFHNDFGMATANALTAIEAGARGVDVTVNGVGNRAGNARSAEVLMALKTIHGIELKGVRYAELTSLARTVERYFGLLEAPFDPITGRLLHLDEASVRTHHMHTVSPTTWLPYAPRDVGAELDAAFTLTSGRNTVSLILGRASAALGRAGVEVTQALIDRAHAWAVAELRGRAATHRPRILALQDLYEDELRRSYVTEKDIVEEALRSAGRFDAAEPRRSGEG